MHAVIGVWIMAPDRDEEQQRRLHEQIVPGVRQFPGFVAGYWMADRTAGKTYTTIVLEDDEAALRFKAFVEGNAANQGRSGVGNESLVVVQVLAEAHR